MVKTLHFFGKQGLAIRGHTDDSISTSANRENFVELLHHSANLTDDNILNRHLINAKRNAAYTSKTTQNELLSCMADSIRHTIIENIKQNTFYSLLADEVKDVSNQQQLCVCLRYYDQESKTVNEEFIDVVTCTATTGESLYTSLLDILAANKLDVRDMRGQGYDGASNMSSARVGVSGRFLQQNDKALYTHCSSH
jgi:hypothetical protein